MNDLPSEFMRTDFGHEVYDTWYLEHAGHNFESPEFIEKHIPFYEKALRLSKRVCPTKGRMGRGESGGKRHLGKNRFGDAATLQMRLFLISTSDQTNLRAVLRRRDLQISISTKSGDWKTSILRMMKGFL